MDSFMPIIALAIGLIIGIPLAYKIADWFN